MAEFRATLGWTARLCGTLDEISSESFGNTLNMSLSKALGETGGKMLGETLGKNLSETFGETLDNTLGEILSEKLSKILDEIIDYPELYTYNKQLYIHMGHSTPNRPSRDFHYFLFLLHVILGRPKKNHTQGFGFFERFFGVKIRKN